MGETAVHAPRRRSITKEQGEILVYLSMGMGDEEIATRVHLSPFSVRNSINSMKVKADVRNRTALIGVAVHAGILLTVTWPFSLSDVLTFILPGN